MSYKYSNGRLTPEGVLEVHRLRLIRKTYQAIAAALGVSMGTVYNVVVGKTWKDLHPSKGSQVPA